MIVPLIARLFGYRCTYDFWRMVDGKHSPEWTVQFEVRGTERYLTVSVSHVSLLMALKMARLVRAKIVMS